MNVLNRKFRRSVRSHAATANWYGRERRLTRRISRGEYIDVIVNMFDLNKNKGGNDGK